MCFSAQYLLLPAIGPFLQEILSGFEVLKYDSYLWMKIQLDRFEGP